MAKDYQDIGLDNQLLDKSSLMVTAAPYTTYTQFDANNEGLGAVKIPDTLKVVQSGSIFLLGNNDTNDSVNGTVFHNIGTPPIFLAYSLLGNGASYQPLPINGVVNTGITSNIGGTVVLSGFSYSVLSASSNQQSIIFNYSGNFFSLGSVPAGIQWAYNIKYYIFRETAK